MSLCLQDLWREGGKRLEAAGIREAELDARYLLLDAFHMDMAHFLAARLEALDEEADKNSIARYREMIKQRGGRMPLQYMIGAAEFMGLEFLVNRHVLIPRQDTETLVEEVLKAFKGRDASILDMCTGSGCIAVSLAVLGGFGQVAAADISAEALAVAKVNAGRLLPAGRKITFVESDLFEGFLEGNPAFDVIVSNPPYISSAVIEGLEPEVRDWEPRLALDGSGDGLCFYRRLASECGKYLKPGGAVFLEIGFDQAEAVAELLLTAGFGDIRVIKDQPGLDRVVRAVWKDKNQEVSYV